MAIILAAWVLATNLQAKEPKYGTFEDTRYEKNKETDKVEAIKETYWTSAKLDRIFDHIKMREIKKKIIQRETILTAKKKMELAKLNKELNGLYRERDKERHNIIVSWNKTVKNNPGMSAEEIAKKASVRRVFKGYGKFMVMAYLFGTTTAVSILVPPVLIGGVMAGASLGATVAAVAGAAGLTGAVTTAAQMALQNRFDKWILTKEAENEIAEWESRDSQLFYNHRTKRTYVKDKNYLEVEQKIAKGKKTRKQEGYFAWLKGEIARIQDTLRAGSKEYDVLNSATIEKLKLATEAEIKKEKKEERINILKWSAIAGGISAVMDGVGTYFSEAAKAAKAAEAAKAAKAAKTAKVGTGVLEETGTLRRSVSEMMNESDFISLPKRSGTTYGPQQGGMMFDRSDFNLAMRHTEKKPGVGELGRYTVKKKSPIAFGYEDDAVRQSVRLTEVGEEDLSRFRGTETSRNTSASKAFGYEDDAVRQSVRLTEVGEEDLSRVGVTETSRNSSASKATVANETNDLRMSASKWMKDPEFLSLPDQASTTNVQQLGGMNRIDGTTVKSGRSKTSVMTPERAGIFGDGAQYDWTYRHSETTRPGGKGLDGIDGEAETTTLRSTMNKGSRVTEGEKMKNAEAALSAKRRTTRSEPNPVVEPASIDWNEIGKTANTNELDDWLDKMIQDQRASRLKNFSSGVRPSSTDNVAGQLTTMKNDIIETHLKQLILNNTPKEQLKAQTKAYLEFFLKNQLDETTIDQLIEKNLGYYQLVEKLPVAARTKNLDDFVKAKKKLINDYEILKEANKPNIEKKSLTRLADEIDDVRKSELEQLEARIKAYRQAKNTGRTSALAELPTDQTNKLKQAGSNSANGVQADTQLVETQPHNTMTLAEQLAAKQNKLKPAGETQINEITAASMQQKQMTLAEQLAAQQNKLRPAGGTKIKGITAASIHNPGADTVSIKKTLTFNEAIVDKKNPTNQIKSQMLTKRVANEGTKLNTLTQQLIYNQQGSKDLAQLVKLTMQAEDLKIQRLDVAIGTEHYNKLSALADTLENEASQVADKIIREKIGEYSDIRILNGQLDGFFKVAGESREVKTILTKFTQDNIENVDLNRIDKIIKNLSKKNTRREIIDQSIYLESMAD